MGYDRLAIVAMQPEDIPAVMVLEEGSLAAWSKKHLEEEFSQQTGFQFVARDTFSKKLLAVVCGRIVADEGEILKLAVDRSVRQQGIGFQVLNFYLDYCQAQGVKRCYLELRSSNVAARQVYQKCGFYETGIRKNYYNSPKEDAILMQREF